MPKIKIAILATSLVPPHPAGTQMLEVIDRLSGEFDFTVFAREIDARLMGKVKFVRMPIPLVKPLALRYTVQFLLYARLFRKQHLASRFDVVHAIEATSPFATVVTMQFCGEMANDLMKQGAISYKGWRKPYYAFLNRLGIGMERKLLRNPFLQQVIAASNGLKRNVLQYHRNLAEAQVKVIPNFSDLARFADARQYRRQTRKQYQIADTDLVGVIVALGDWQRKGLDLLIDAFVREPQPDIRILVVGGGPIGQYQKICAEKAVSHNFIFAGFQRNLEHFYGAGDFFIFPSAFEAFPIVVLEAAAAGLPVVASRINGTEDIIEHGVNGLFFERNAADIADKLSWLSEHRAMLPDMGSRIVQLTAGYSREGIAAQYRNFYHQLVGVQKGRREAVDA